MSDQQQIFQPPSGCDKPGVGSRDNNVLRSVVKNVVVNMESVLNDLHGIMGEITTIVKQIDNVTEKMDKNYRMKKETTSLMLTNNSLHKHPWANSSKYKTDIENNFYNTESDTDKSLLAQHYQPQNSHSVHNILKVNGFNKSQKLSLNEPPKPIPHKSYVPISKDKHYDTLSFIPKSFCHFPKDRSRSMHQAGAIAIVYPTIINNASVQSQGNETSHRRKTESQEPAFKEECIEDSRWQKCANNNYMINNPENTLFQSLPLERKPTKDKWKKQQIEGTAPIYNECMKSPTPSKQRYSVSQRNDLRELHKDITSLVWNGESTTLDLSTELDTTVAVKSTGIQLLTENSARFETPIFKDYALEFYNDSPQMKHLPLNTDSNVSAPSPLLKESSQKSVYARVQVSPVNEESMDSTLQCQSVDCFYSTESDLNAETPDNRCATPVIDYSYLNLVGNNAILNNTMDRLHSNGSHQKYNIPSDHVDKHENIHLQELDNDVTFAGIIAPSLVTAELTFSQSQSSMRSTHNVFCSPVWTHIFCSEVTLYESGGYCGCYEAILDSILENIAGFESFEEACEDFDCIGVLNKTYVIFENEYEEDDWGIGLEFGDQPDYVISSINIQDDGEENFGTLEIVDNSRYLVADNSHSLQQKQASVLSQCMNSSLPKGTNEDKADVIQQRKIKNIIYPAKGMCVANESQKLLSAALYSFSEENCGAIKARVSNQQPTFSLRPDSFNSSGMNLWKEMTHSQREFKTRISGDTSCLVAGSGSPMSLNSLDATMSEGMMTHSQREFKTRISGDISCLVAGSGSPMSLNSLDVSLTMSEGIFEGDDLLGSPDDSRSLRSETRVKVSTTIHKARMRKMRREFFKSMYTAGEARELDKEEDKETRPISGQRICLGNTLSAGDNSIDNISESDSYQEAVASYNKNINPWTAYALVHEHADDMSDSASDIFNDNSVSCSITTSSEADNNAASLGAQV